MQQDRERMGHSLDRAWGTSRGTGCPVLQAIVGRRLAHESSSSPDTSGVGACYVADDDFVLAQMCLLVIMMMMIMMRITITDASCA